MRKRMILSLLLAVSLAAGCTAPSSMMNPVPVENTEATQSSPEVMQLPVKPSYSKMPQAREVEKQVDIYLIPLDDFSEDFSVQMAKELSEEFRIWVKSTLPMGTKGLQPFTGTDQYAAEDIFDMADMVIHRLPEQAADTNFIFLTNKDINSRKRNFRFLFSWHDKGRRASLVSAARMHLDLDNSDRGMAQLRSRFVKMTKRAIGEMHFGWTRSSNINDLMYSPIMSLSDIDRIGNNYLIAPK